MNARLVLFVAVTCAAASILLAAVALALPQPRRKRMLRTLAAFAGAPADEQSQHQSARRSAVLLLLVDRLGVLLAPPGDRRRLSRLLDQAGNPTEWPLSRLIRLRPLAAVALAGAGVFFGHAWGGGRGLVIGAVVGAVGGCMLPQLLIYNVAIKRQEELLRALPDVMDAMVIGVEAGLGLDSAMDQVARAVRGPMAEELRRVLQEMRLGVSRAEALRSLAGRTTVRDLKRVVTALVQAGDLGIPVGNILREHAQDQRMRRRQRAEELAQKIPVKLLFPVLFCMFPAIFVVIVGPAVLQLAKAFGNI